MENITGYVENIIYYNEYNNYTVMDLDCNGNLVTTTGCFPNLKKGEYISIVGTWKDHPNYGVQFDSQSFKLETPTTTEGIERYLSSGIIHGIGKKKAKLLLEHFGEDVLDIIRYYPLKLVEIPGIGEKTAEKISQSFNEQRELMNIIMFLNQYGLSTSISMKLYKVYKDNTISVIKENPYKIINDISGIGFKTADQIAMSLGIEETSPFRLMSGIKYCLQSCFTEGNTYLKEEDLIYKSSILLNVSEDFINHHLLELTLQGEIKLQNIRDERVYYLLSLFKAEENVANIINELSNFQYENTEIDIETEIKKYEKNNELFLDENQINAVKAAIDNGIIIITGGPGTGKTTIINCILYIFEQLKLDIALAAPTGRAAKRVFEATNKEAKTMHRLLEYGFSLEGDNQEFERNEKNPLEHDVVIIDEASMIDITLMNSLLKAIPLGTRLILVGDTNQLPSVGPGNVLRDLIESNIIKVVKLTKIFRQAQESLIVVNAHRINNGETPLLNEKDKDFFFINCMTPEKIQSNIIEICTKRLKNYKGYNPIEDIQVITPVKKGPLGVFELNKQLQKRINPPDNTKNEKTFPSYTFREGDKVMQIKNNYNIEWENINNKQKGKGIFNGDIGLVYKIDDEEKIVTILYDNEKKVEYKFQDMDEIMLSYAITVHKSQGSEFPVVIMPISRGPRILLNRNLLYTAITRAKELVILVGQKHYLEFMINNNNNIKRLTGLKERIADNIYRESI